ncbi:hypothetical protein F4678DRAFT_467554 [Xylaria arbuscula]|nr:hypothetical protein F4678DRAFT_467554 [Xylaria arbuscula]
MSTPAGDDVDVAFREAQSYSDAGQRWGLSGAVAPHVAQQAIEQAERVNVNAPPTEGANTGDGYSNTDGYYGGNTGDDVGLTSSDYYGGNTGDDVGLTSSDYYENNMGSQDGLIWQTSTNNNYSHTDGYYGSDMGDDGSLALATLNSGYGGDEYDAPSGTGQSGSSAQGTVTHKKRGPVQVSKSSLRNKAMWTCPCCQKTSSKKQKVVEHQSKRNHY